MTQLVDDCWLLIFERLNLNERRVVRSTCKRFRDLCDKIKIYKLIIYEKLPPIAGRLRYTNEPYGLEHTVYVVNLNRFFNDEQIVFKQMRSIRSLVVHGDGRFAVDLKAKFKQLNYLELHNCKFSNPILLSSTKLEYIIFDDVHLRPPHQVNEKAKKILAKPDESLFWFLIGFEKLTKSLKYLSLAPEISMILVATALDSHVFDNLEEADVTVTELVSIGIFARSGNFPNLRKLNCIIKTDDVEAVVDFLAETDTRELFSIFSNQLTVYLFGLQFSQINKPALVGFLKPFGKKIQEHKGRLNIQVDQQIYKHIKKWRKNHNLEHFFKLVSTITLADDAPTFDKAFFQKFSPYCHELICLTNPSPADFERILDTLNNLKTIQLHKEIYEKKLYANKLLNLIGQKCPLLETLMFESWEKINFGFLMKLQRLKHLYVRLLYPFPQDILFDMLRKHRDLTEFDIYFERSSESENEISAFEKRVNDEFSERFKARKLGFHVVVKTLIHQYVWYALEKKPIEQTRECKAKVFSIVKSFIFWALLILPVVYLYQKFIS